MSVIIPLFTDTEHFTITCTLDGAEYGFDFLWSTRDGAWYFSVLDADGTLLLAHRKAAVNVPLLIRFLDDRLPPGQLYLRDTANTETEAGRYDLGNRCQLFYVGAAEV